MRPHDTPWLESVLHSAVVPTTYAFQRLYHDSRERKASVRHSCSSLWMSQGTQAQQIVFGQLGSTLQLHLVFTMSTHFATRDTAVEITIPFPSPEELYREVRDHEGMWHESATPTWRLCY